MKPFVNESAENYLETILMLSKKLPVVRSVDIANELDFKKSSVSVAMKNLREKNHITVTDAGFIYLTESGREIAEMIYERHRLLSDWLIRLGVSEEHFYCFSPSMNIMTNAIPNITTQTINAFSDKYFTQIFPKTAPITKQKIIP